MLSKLCDVSLSTLLSYLQVSNQAVHDFAKSIISYLKHTSHFFNHSVLNSPQIFISREGWNKKYSSVLAPGQHDGLKIYIAVMTQYNNNNSSFQSQTSWGRLELKPIISRHGSGTWIANFHAPLSTPKQEKSTTGDLMYRWSLKQRKVQEFWCQIVHTTYPCHFYRCGEFGFGS